MRRTRVRTFRGVGDGVVTRCVSPLCQSLPGGFITGDSRGKLDGLDLSHVEFLTIMQVTIISQGLDQWVVWIKWRSLQVNQRKYDTLVLALKWN